MDNLRWKMVVLDDDPTGIQTVHGCLLITQWDEDSVRKGFADAEPADLLSCDLPGYCIIDSL